ncbi:MAG: hypothetical protein Q8R47_02040 [Nanoarchaeota archaeon]|nr:hypothetical protein [Nanoarchaeota archaeon]
MDKRFPGDRNLADILKWYGWALYDITISPARVESLSWDEIEMQDAAKYYSLFHRYSLLPIPEDGQTLREVYKRSREAQTYPVLKIPSQKRTWEMSLKKQEYHLQAEHGFAHGDSRCYFLNEFYFREDTLSTSSSPYVFYDYPSKLIIPAAEVIDVFTHHFTIATFTDTGPVCKEPLGKLVIN